MTAADFGTLAIAIVNVATLAFGFAIQIPSGTLHG
jgi:hypothetical protein